MPPKRVKKAKRSFGRKGFTGKNQNKHKSFNKSFKQRKKAKPKKASLLSKEGKALEANLVEVVIKDILEHRKKLTKEQRNEQLNKMFLAEVLKEDENVIVKTAKGGKGGEWVNGDIEDLLHVTSESPSLIFTPTRDAGTKGTSKKKKKDQVTKPSKELIRKPGKEGETLEIPEVTKEAAAKGEEEESSCEEESGSETEEGSNQTEESGTESEGGEENEKSTDQSKKTAIAVPVAQQPGSKSDKTKTKPTKSAKTKGGKVVVIEKEQDGKRVEKNKKDVKDLQMLARDIVKDAKQIAKEKAIQIQTNDGKTDGAVEAGPKQETNKQVAMTNKQGPETKG